MRTTFLCLAALVITSVPAQLAVAQVLYGSLVGSIEDPTGSFVPKADVTLTNKSTGVTRSAVSDDQGRYSLLNVLPGAYDLKVTAPGFRTLNRTDIEIAINTVTRQD